MEYFLKTGVSSENAPYRILLEYQDGAPAGDDATRLVCLYDAEDGFGMVGIQRTPEGVYRRCDSAVTQSKPHDLLPHVVQDGIDDAGSSSIDSSLFLSYWLSCEKST